MRQKGNHIQVGYVLIALFAALLVLLIWLMESNDRYHIADYDDIPTPVATESCGGVSAGNSDNAIGPQRSPEKDSLLQQLNQQMNHFFDNQVIE